MARILVIDDDDLLREILVEALRQAGHMVTAATNGREGVRSFHAEPPDLVITDIVMPEEDGVKLIMALKLEEHKVPVIAMSGGVFNSPFYLGIAQKLGAQRTLGKPFTIAVLLQTIAELLPVDALPSRR